MIHKPKFITFTGVDETTPIVDLITLMLDYPVEIGVLFSPKRQGSGRYPSKDFLTNLFLPAICNARAKHGETLPLAAHLCGEHARSAIHRGITAVDDVVRRFFDRAQLNVIEEHARPTAADEWAHGARVKAILQTRDPLRFPLDTRVQWLYDPSGGRGVAQTEWPLPNPDSDERVMRGYAGGINPSNVAEVVRAVGANDANYWLDMESGVRDEHDRFSLERCRKVCEAVYGAPVTWRP